jgi:hypothetical protein
MSDRGYRDEVGAAVERLEKLEEENAALRDELERLDAPKRLAAKRRSAGVCALLLGVTFAMGVGAFSHGFACPHRARQHRHSFTPQRTHRTLDVRTRAPDELQVIRHGDDCTLPYYYDSNNVRRWKQSCIEAVETLEP